MTRAADHTTFAFEGEDDVWAAKSAVSFLPGGHLATREEFIDWFVERNPPTGWLARKLSTVTYPMPLSSAMGGVAIRYLAVNGSLFLDWVAFSRADTERLEAIGPLPSGARLKLRDHSAHLVFDRDRPLHLARDVELARCTHGDGVHWYSPQFGEFDRRVIRVDGTIE